MIIPLSHDGAFEYLGVTIQTTLLEKDSRILDLNNKSVLIQFGKCMELSNCLESMKRWLWNTKIGRYFGGEERIFKMAQEKIKELFYYTNYPLISIHGKRGYIWGKIPSAQEMDIEDCVRKSFAMGFKEFEE
jgi:hypothetical protein